MDIHKRISGVFPRPPRCSCVTIVTQMTLPDFPKIVITASTLDAALLEVKQQIEKALRQYKKPPIPTKQEQIVVPQNSVLVWRAEPEGVPRMTEDTNNRALRLKTLGNAVCPPQAYPIFQYIAMIETGACVNICPYGIGGDPP